MSIRIAQLYLSVPQNGVSIVTVGWDGAGVLSLSAGLSQVSNIVRADFYDSTGAASPMVAISCIAASSTVTLDTFLPTVAFRLSLRCALAAAPDDVQPLSATVNASNHSSLTFSTGIGAGGVPDFSIGRGGNSVVLPSGASPVQPLDYDAVLTTLAELDRIDIPAGDVQSGNHSSIFEQNTGCVFNSGHVSFHTRNLHLAGGGSIPVLTVRRGFTQTGNGTKYPGAFSFELFNQKKDSPFHTVQFPRPDWFESSHVEPSNWIFETGEFPQSTVASFYHDQVLQPYLRGLRIINAQLPISTLPTLEWLDQGAGGAAITPWHIIHDVAVDADSGAFIFSTERLLPAGYLDTEAGTTPQPINVKGALAAFRTHTGDALRFTATIATDPATLGNTPAIVSSTPSKRTTATQPPSLTRRLQMKLGSLAALDLQMVRLGSLDLSFAGTLDSSADLPEYRIDFDSPPFAEGDWLPRVFLKGPLPLARYAPGGQDNPVDNNEFRLTADPGVDDITGFTRAAPIVIDAGLVSGAQAQIQTTATAPFRLMFDELTQPYPQPQQLALTLSPAVNVNAGIASIPRAMVLDREPFFIAFVALDSSLANNDATDVGVWCNVYPEGPGWRLFAGAAGFNMFLPPQAVGEAMVKSLNDPAIQDGSPGAPPQTASLIDYRLSPAFSARMLASYFARNAVEPGWNSRRLLGYNGQGVPGAVVDGANGGVKFELLYGMTTSVTQPSLRLSEIEARLGRYPGPLPQLDGPATRNPQYTKAQRDAYTNAAQAWADLYDELIRRPSILELWDVDNTSPDLVLDTGVSYSFRPEVFYTDPNDRVQPTPKPSKPLHGGVGYGIDSPNIRGELLTQPASTAGKLVSPRFTPLGGYGKQRAEFANGKVIIDSTTSLGRLESLTITLVGRIGVLYNHALHVTVYERTVEASDQFATEQPALGGRPLLRKTAEYVDILEVNRAYPESVTSDPTAAGFVRGSHFKSQRIYVDSNWGGDVGDVGWQVPLWKPGAVPSQVYPRPHIGLDVAVDPALGINTAAGEISDPEKLCFYTDTRLGTAAGAFATANTDSWPAVPTIDYIDQPEFQQTPQARAGVQDPSVEPGFGKFTYHFVSSPAQVNLTAERSKTAVGATLRNASMMRQTRGTPAAGTAQIMAQSVRRAQDWWTAARAHILQGVAGSTIADTTKAIAAIQEVKNSYLDTTNTAANGLIKDLNSIASIPGKTCDAIQARLMSAVNRLNRDGQGFVTAVLVQVPDRWIGELKGVAVGTADQYALDLKAKIQFLASDGATALQPAIADLDTISKQLAAYQASLNAFKASIDAGITQTGKAIADATGAELQNLQKMLPNLSSTSPGSDRSKLDSAASVLAGALRQILGDATPSVIADLEPELDCDIARVAAGGAAVSEAMTDALNALKGELASAEGDVSNAFAACGSAITQLQTIATTTKQPLADFFPNLQSSLDTAIDNAKAQGKDMLQAAIDLVNTQTTADSINQQIQAQATWIGAQSSAFCNLLSSDANAILGSLKSYVQGGLQDLLNGLIDHPDLNAISTALQQADARIGQQFSQIAQPIIAAATTFEDTVSSAALHVLRAFGEPPVVPTMDFKGLDGSGNDIPLPTMAFKFFDGVPAINLTPAWTKVQQAADGLGDALQQLNIGLPTTTLLDRLLPASLENYDLSTIFPNFAGLNLADLFSGVTMPSLANDNVRVTHHLDPQHKRASLDADIDVPFAGETQVLKMGPVTLVLTNAEFTAQVHCEVTVGQQVQQVSSGQITGDWQLLVCGTQIVSFTRTTLSFDSSGHLHFDIKAPNVRLADVLQFLADMVNSISFGDSGFSLHMNPAPLSVQGVLDLPLPDMSAGAFGIQNLRFGALFEIGFDESFYLGCGANLARKTEPFILTIFILGGAGWMEAYLRYQNGKALGKITIGLAASASLAIALGPISGSVSIQFGVFAEFLIGGNGGLQLGIMILVSGRVSVLGIIDASITLLLEAVYTSGGGLLGRGTVSIKIKICWCFTLKVQAGVSYSFGKAGGSSHTLSVNTQTALPAQAAAATATAPSVLTAATPAAGRANAAFASPAAIPGAAVPAPPSPFDTAKQAALAYINLFV